MADYLASLVLSWTWRGAFAWVSLTRSPWNVSKISCQGEASREFPVWKLGNLIEKGLSSGQPGIHSKLLLNGHFVLEEATKQKFWSPDYKNSCFFKCIYVYSAKTWAWVFDCKRVLSPGLVPLASLSEPLGGWLPGNHASHSGAHRGQEKWAPAFGLSRNF